VRPEQTVGQVVELMRDKSVGCVLVSEQGKIVGIFTERDLMRRVLAAGKSLDAPIRDFMTANPVAVSSKDPIEKAVRLMEEGGYRHLPVVDQGKPVGILSVKRIVHYLVEHFPTAVYNLPPDSQASVGKNREGA
jgi:CBS domain-containing protein